MVKLILDIFYLNVDYSISREWHAEQSRERIAQVRRTCLKRSNTGGQGVNVTFHIVQPTARFYGN